MVSPLPNVSAPDSQRQLYRGNGIPVYRFPPIPQSNAGATTTVVQAASATTKTAAETAADPWLLGGNNNTFPQGLGTLGPTDVPLIANGQLRAKLLAGGGISFPPGVAVGSNLAPDWYEVSLNTSGYVVWLEDNSLLNPKNEFRGDQSTLRVSRTTPDTNQYAVLTANVVVADTTITVDRSDPFTNGMVIQIDNEQMTVNGTPTLAHTVTVTRSAPAAHLTGTPIFYLSGGTVVAQGLGWDIRPSTTTAVMGPLTLSDAVYRGSVNGITNEFLYLSQGQTTDFSLPNVGQEVAISQLAANNRIWEFDGCLIGQPATTAGAKISANYALRVLNQDSGTLDSTGVTGTIDALSVAALKLDGLNRYGGIVWNGIYLSEIVSGALGFYTMPTATVLTSSVSAAATSWPVSSSAGFSANDICLCEGEFVKVNGAPPDGTHLNVLRAQRGTTAFAHYGGTAPAVTGRIVTNLTATQRGRWDATSLKVGDADGSSSGSCLELKYNSGTSTAAVFGYNYAGAAYRNLTIDGLVTSINSSSLAGVGIGIAPASIPSDVWLICPAVDATATKRVPLRFNNGTAGLVTPVDGSWEYYGSVLYYTIGSTRQALLGAGVGAWLIGGNTVGAAKNLGSLDGFDVVLIASGSERMRLVSGGNITTQTNVDVGGWVNTSVGYRVSGGATTGHVLRGNGTNFVDAALAAGDLSNGTTGTGAVVLASAISGFLSANGVNFGPAPVASITVVNGQITAIS